MDPRGTSHPCAQARGLADWNATELPALLLISERVLSVTLRSETTNVPRWDCVRGKAWSWEGSFCCSPGWPVLRHAFGS